MRRRENRRRRAAGRWWQDAGFRELRQILYWTWDPIGVNDAFPRTEAEYDGYALHLGGMLVHGADAGAVADYLLGVEEGMMPLPPDPEKTAEVAERIMAWYADSRDLWEENLDRERLVP